MELTNTFRVGVPVEQAWAVLTDVERIAPCLPGAQLQEVAGDEYRGIVRVKVGPITAQYKGAAKFVEQDRAAGRVVLRAEGRDTRGQGNAMATITATLTPDGTGTSVSVVTDLTVTGKVAQFGRGVLADVSAKLLDQFVACLEADVLSSGDHAGGNGAKPGGKPPAAVTAQATAVSAGGGSSGAGPLGAGAPVTEAPAPPQPAEGAVRRIESAPSEPVDLLQMAGQPLAKRAAPPLLGLAVLLGAVLYVRRRRSRRPRG